MIITIIIFFIAIITCFGMLTFRAWEIRTLRVKPEEVDGAVPEISFRHVEKSMLYLTKHIIQGIVLTVAKWWFILTTRTKKWLGEKWPKVHAFFKKKEVSPVEKTPPSFVKRAIIESKTKIKRIREKVKKEHGEEDKKTLV